jgi:hypothetical protein
MVNSLSVVTSPWASSTGTPWNPFSNFEAIGNVTEVKRNATSAMTTPMISRGSSVPDLLSFSSSVPRFPPKGGRNRELVPRNRRELKGTGN